MFSTQLLIPIYSLRKNKGKGALIYSQRLNLGGLNVRDDERAIILCIIHMVPVLNAVRPDVSFSITVWILVVCWLAGAPPERTQSNLSDEVSINDESDGYCSVDIIFNDFKQRKCSDE